MFVFYDDYDNVLIGYYINKVESLYWKLTWCSRYSSVWMVPGTVDPMED